ncbi:hypothetical protein K440DRAFT_643524 [Wilcoxina mikolae CBS 423.85]|nr:hypothetical protein K440DRAFT_643524 [Wilcoxina mikolae CBS 423.85]
MGLKPLVMTSGLIVFMFIQNLNNSASSLNRSTKPYDGRQPARDLRPALCQLLRIISSQLPSPSAPAYRVQPAPSRPDVVVSSSQPAGRRRLQLAPALRTASSQLSSPSSPEHRLEPAPDLPRVTVDSLLPSRIHSIEHDNAVYAIAPSVDLKRDPSHNIQCEGIPAGNGETLRKAGESCKRLGKTAEFCEKRLAPNGEMLDVCYISQRVDDYHAYVLFVNMLLFPKSVLGFMSGNIGQRGSIEAKRLAALWEELERSPVWKKYVKAALDEDIRTLDNIQELLVMLDARATPVDFDATMMESDDDNEITSEGPKVVDMLEGMGINCE